MTAEEDPVAGLPAATSEGARQASAVMHLPQSVRVLGLVVGGLLALLGTSLYYLRPASPGRSLTITEVLRASAERRIFTARLLEQDDQVIGRFSVGGVSGLLAFHAAYPASDATRAELLKTLVANDATVSVDPQSEKAVVGFLSHVLLPTFLLGGMLALVLILHKRDLRPEGTGAGTAGAPLRRAVGTRFADVAGADEAVAELVDLRDYLTNPSTFEGAGARPPKGVLLVGPSGCGKTLLAEAVAGEAGVPLLALLSQKDAEPPAEPGASRVGDVFDRARRAAPAVLYVDALEAMSAEAVAELMAQVEAVSVSDGLVVIAAAERAEMVEPSLLRSGRFDRQVHVMRPDRAARLAILRLHGRDKHFLDSETDLTALVGATAGFTGADLASVLNDAAFLAVRDGAEGIGPPHLALAVDRATAGTTARAVAISATEMRRLAVHHAGHAVVASVGERRQVIDRVSLMAVSHVVCGGGKPTGPESDLEIAIALAGMAAEAVVLGAQRVDESDLAHATAVATELAGQAGSLESTELADSRGVGPEVGRILKEQAAWASRCLAANRAVLDSLAEALAVEETIKGDELWPMLDGVVAPAVEAKTGRSTPPARQRRKTTKPDNEGDRTA